jgi:hypothetical protein
MVYAKALTGAMLVSVAFLTTGCFDRGSSGTPAATSGSGSSASSSSSSSSTGNPATSGVANLSLLGSPPNTVTVGSNYYFQPVAQGVSNASYSISGKPAWASFSASTGQLTGSPQAEHVGIYGNITITANNGSGTITLGPFSISVVATNSASILRTGSGTATLVWDIPVVNTDGSTLVDLAGYKIYFGNSDSDLSQVIDVANATTTSFVVDKLGSGTYYFAISAYNSAGVESAMKLVGSKQIG